MIRRAARILLLGLLLLLVLQFFSILTFQPESNTRPLPPAYKKGAYHVHSVFSDGRGDVARIARAAARDGLDFVILTDHGRANLKSSRATQWLDDVLIIGASEFSTSGGHLAALGYPAADYIFPPEPEAAIAEVNRSPIGSTFIAHPLSRQIPWTDWQATNISGVEILNGYQSARDASFFKMVSFPVQYLWNSDYALTALLKYPQRELQIWDRLLAQHRCWGINALDAHAQLQLTRSWQLSIPSYEAMFRIMTLYVKVDRDWQSNASASAATVLAAIRQGRFFSVIESLAPANGFDCQLQLADDRRLETGTVRPESSGSLVFRLPFEFATDIDIRRDGQIWRRIKRNLTHEVRVPLEKPGVYRSEIFISGSRFRRLPWILTNPVFLGVGDTPAHGAASPPPGARRDGVPLLQSEFDFQIEKNPASTADLKGERNHSGEPKFLFNFHLRREASGPDFWTALASRRQRDFSGYRGIVFDALADRRMLFWVQIRSGSEKRENAYRHSFMIDREWQTVVLPFDRLLHLYGDADRPDLKAIQSLFIMIDNEAAFSGQTGTVQLKNFGLY